MTGPKKFTVRIHSIGAFVAAAFVLFFTAYVQPHRVHHFFEQLQPANHAESHGHDHDSHHQKDNQPAKTADCVFQVSANRCIFGQTSLAPSFDFAFVYESLIVSHAETNHSSDQFKQLPIRAPPLA